MYKCERQDEILELLSDTEYATVDYLAKKSFSLTYGARNLRRTIQKEIEDVIAARIVDEFKGQVSRIRLSADEGNVLVEAER